MSKYRPHPALIPIYRDILVALVEESLWYPPPGVSIDDVVEQTDWEPARRLLVLGTIHSSLPEATDA